MENEQKVNGVHTPLDAIINHLEQPTTDSAAALKAELDKLRAENAHLKAENSKKTGSNKLTLKASEKGAVSVYGLGRFPVTLYREQWEKLMAPEFRTDLETFIAANSKLLTVKEK